MTQSEEVKINCRIAYGLAKIILARKIFRASKTSGVVIYTLQLERKVKLADGQRLDELPAGLALYLCKASPYSFKLCYEFSNDCKGKAVLAQFETKYDWDDNLEKKLSELQQPAVNPSAPDTAPQPS